MSKIVISVDIKYADDGTDLAELIKVVNSTKDDITNIYREFCVSNGYDIVKKSEIESAALPFIQKFENTLP